MGAEQLGLPGVPRLRARLDDADAGGARVGDAAPGAPEMEVDPEGLAGYSAWECVEPPPDDGHWEVTDNRTGAMRERWWFSRSRGPLVWFPPSKLHFGGIMHDEFTGALGLAWRGLRDPRALMYPCPPYDAARLRERAFEQGVLISTTFPARERARL